MAFSLKITARPTDEAQPTTEITPAWWDYRELLRNHPFTKQLSHGYLDYRLTVSKEEFVNLFLEQMPRLEKPMYAHPDWQKINTREMEKLTWLVQQPGDLVEIEILIYEWES
jgi:hypothetical protein